ncbi:protein of unknown function [Candidatus Nitrotoga arctica]|uniref:Uncharacterized protein n=1 Tax=Candidatus Nitrotoga arctica TaxID=453162 RepID=A0ABM8YY79_9PROT|nr:protein of unknown function [Candidatus Nitrotoga arctica]
MEPLIDNKNEYISGGARDLRRHGIHGVADEKFSAQMEFDVFEDQFVASASQSKRSELQ